MLWVFRLGFKHLESRKRKIILYILINNNDRKSVVFFLHYVEKFKINISFSHTFVEKYYIMYWNFDLKSWKTICSLTSGSKYTFGFYRGPLYHKPRRPAYLIRKWIVDKLDTDSSRANFLLRIPASRLIISICS